MKKLLGIASACLILLLFLLFSGCKKDDKEEEQLSVIIGQPCPDIPSITYGGQVYNTVLIGNQCWMKENLNIGIQIPGGTGMQDNDVIEKYCNGDSAQNCEIYGGLYQWDELMQYTTQQGTQGICPSGWHIPTDEEWKVLEGTVDSKYGVGDPIWDIAGGPRGYDAGTNLKTTTGWNDDGNGIDLFGFSGFPGGLHISSGFYHIGFSGNWWTSTEYDNYETWSRHLNSPNPEVSRVGNSSPAAFSVRCLRNY